MHTINIPTMIDLIVHVGFEMKQPLMFWGPPGVGKSEGVKGAIQRLMSTTGQPVVLVDVRLSQYDSVDLRGIPVPSEELTVWHAPSTMPFKSNPKFSDEGIIVLFLDEINSAAPSVAAVAYQLINDRAVGEHELRDNVVIVAAGNREGDKGVTNRMPTPLANRFTHAEIAEDVNAWCEWAISAGLRREGVAFMQFRKPLLNQFDPSKPDKSFPTPRSWEKALRYYDADMPDNLKRHAIAGAVGEGAAAEFWGYIDVYQKVPSIKEIIKNPDKVEVPGKADLRYATAVAISGEMNEKTVKPLVKYLSRMSVEFQLLAWKMALAHEDGANLYTTEEFMDFAADHKGIFNPA